MSETPRILVIRLGAMGDVLLATPALRALRARFPSARIDVLVKSAFAPLVAGHPAVDGVIVFDRAQGFRQAVQRVRAGRYTHVADLQSNPRSRWAAWRSGAPHRVRFHHDRFKRWLLLRFHWDLYREERPVPQRYLEALSAWGVTDDGRGLELAVDTESRSTAQKWLGERGIPPGSPIVALAPGAAWPTKRWPEERYQVLARHFAEAGNHVLVLGGPEETERCRRVALAAGARGHVAAGGFTRMETGALLASARLLVTNDTGLMHMACALDRPVVAVFGPTARQLGFFPFRARSRVVETDLPCRPCAKHGSKACPKGHFRCMLDIDPETVMKACAALLEASPSETITR